MGRKMYPETPDGRYFVAKRRLWRKTNPSLPELDREAAVKELMRARRAVGSAGGAAAMREARAAVDAAKRRLGERGAVWWADGSPDEGGKHPKNTSYADWWAGLSEAQRKHGS
ncbi:hypothetical protein DIPPA_09095 [Diplonema papillatum]|nr:hypothetical protein DIPPA_09095 [Diplonema papillatum]